MITNIERDRQLDQIFAQIYAIEKRGRKTKKELEKIAKYLTPAECDETAKGCDEIIALLREIKATATSAPANPDARAYRMKTKAAYLKIYRDAWMAERARKVREGLAAADRYVREVLEGKRPRPLPSAPPFRPRGEARTAGSGGHCQYPRKHKVPVLLICHVELAGKLPDKSARARRGDQSRGAVQADLVQIRGCVADFNSKCFW
jgi:hypothetical protein